MDLNTNHGFDLKEAALSKLELSDGRGFFLSGGSQFIRLPFCALNEEEIATGIERLSEVITAFHKGM